MDANNREPRHGFLQIDLKDYTADPSAGRISWREHRLASDSVRLPKRSDEPTRPPR